MYNNAVVSDLQCRFSEGEVVTWEEFYKWIDDILDGFDTHDHSGVSGGGPVLNIANITGYAALEARVAALESAGYATESWVASQISDMATETWVGLHYMTNADIAYQFGLRDDQLATLAGAINDNTAAIALCATETWVALNYYNKTKYDADLVTVSASIVDNLMAIGTNADDIDACEGRLNTIEATYATQAWVSGLGYATQLWVGDNFYTQTQIDGLADDVAANSADIDACEGRLNTIESSYATEAWVTGLGYATVSYVSTNYFNCTEVTHKVDAVQDDVDANAWDISDNADDINACESRLDAIELNYATESWVESQDYATETYAFNAAESVSSDVIIEHESWCINYDH